MKKLSQKIVAGGFGLALLLLTGVGAASYWSGQKLIENKQWVEHTREVLENIDKIFDGLRDAQLARRRYFVTRKPVHLETYQIGIQTSKDAIKAVRELTRDNPGQQQKINKIEPVINQRFIAFQQSIEAIQQNQWNNLNEIVITNQGWELQKNIKDKLGEMEKEEQALLKQRVAATEASVNNTIIGIGLGYCLSFALLLGVYLLLHKQIRDRLAAETTLLKRERELRTVLENTPDAIVRMDRQLRHLYVNSALSQELEIPAEEFIGKTIFEMGFPEEFTQFLVAKCQKVFATGEKNLVEFCFPSSTGIKFIQSYDVPEFAPDGSVESLLSISRDITNIKQAEAALQLANEQLEIRVQERTAQLSKLNEELQAEITERQRVEEALHTFAAEFQDLYNNAPCGYHSIDKDGNFILINDTELKMLGYTQDEVIGKKITDLLPPESLLIFQKNFSLLQQRGSLQDLEFQMIRKDGTLVDMSLNAIAIKDEAGNFIMSRSAILDITARKQAETALQQQAQQQRLVLEIAQRIRQSLDLNEILQTTVQEVRQFLGTDRAIIFQFEPDYSGKVVVESVGEEWTAIQSTTIYDPCFGESYVEPFKQGLVTAKADIYTAGIGQCHLDLLSHFQVRANLVVPILQGENLWGLLIAHHCSAPRQWQQLEIDLLRQLATQVGIAIQQSTLFEQVQRELKERKRAEAALYQSNSILRSVLESTLDFVYVKDMQSRYVAISTAAADWIGVGVDDIVGKDDTELLPPQIAQQFIQTDRKIVTTGESLLYEESAIREETRRTLLTMKCPWRDSQGNIIGAIGISRDISDRKMAEEAIAQARDELEIRVQERTKELTEANEALKAEIAQRIETQWKLEQITVDLRQSNQELEQFAYLASHDLQEPLRAVEGYTQLLVQEYQNLFDAPAQEYAGFIVDGTSRMRQLIQDLLAYSRVGTRGQKFVPTDCNEVLRLVLHDLQVAIAETNANITYDPLPSLKADTTQVIQLFQNLIGNAIKFHRQEPPQVHISAELSNNEYLFKVRDNGIGIKPRYLERIFEIFKRLHTRRDFPGTGIGLAICKKIVERHGGRIWAESEPGVGTTFFFTLPLTPNTCAPEARKAQ